MIDEQLAGTWFRAFAPPPKVKPSDFAEREIVLPSSANSIPGPLRLAAYQRELVDAIADDECEFIVMQLSSQVGKSLSVECQIAHCIANEPGPALHVSPTSQRAVDFVRDRLDALIAASPTLRKIVGTGDKRKGTDSVSAKSFAGGQIGFASSFKADELAARSIKMLWLDEVDRFAVSASNGEGSPIDLAIKRTQTFRGRGRKIVLVSTPTSRSGSRINEWFLKGDQRRFMMACHDCGVAGSFTFANLHWAEGKPETAYVSCGECGCVIDETRRRDMIESGVWVPTAQGEPGVRSYHLSELTSKFSTMEAVVRQYEAAKTPMQKQVFHNVCLGEVYDAGVEVELTSSELAARAEPIAAPYAANTRFVTAGVDVQSNRLECTVLAHHADETCTVLNHMKLMGDTSGNSVWQALDAALSTTYPLENGKMLGITASAVDCGFNADNVMAFVHSQRRKGRRCDPVKGKAGFGEQALRWGGRLKGQMRILLVGVDVVKFAVQKSLAMQSIGPGYIRLPDHLPPEYFDGLASEELRVKIVKGAPRYEWFRTIRLNEPLDCLVYAKAIASAVPKQALIPPSSTPGPSLQESARKLHAALNPNQ